jgi:KDO2-lipid IV(A) lauroyltransferase
MVNAVGRLGGSAFFLLSRSKRSIMMRELSSLLGNRKSLHEGKMNEMVKRGLQEFSMRQIENLTWGKMDRQLIERMVSIEGLQHLDNVLKKNKGAILLTAHFGSHLLPPIALGFKGYRVHQIAGPPLVGKQRRIYRKIFNLRERESQRLPLDFIVIGTSMRPVFRLLSNNEILFIAFDGTEAKDRIPVEFFKGKAFFAPGPFKLAMKTGATILPTFIVRQKNNAHRVVIERPFNIETSVSEKETLLLNTERFARIFEEYVRSYPCHYAMTLMRVNELVKEGALKASIFRN